MTGRFALAALLGIVAGACAERGVTEEAGDEEARAVCEGLCDRWERCGPEYYATPDDCMDDCALGPMGRRIPRGGTTSAARRL